MIQINQNEAEYLRAKKYGYLIHISSATHKSKAKRYYVTEEPKALKALKEYRESVILSGKF